jgi:hypothetical protein
MKNLVLWTNGEKRPIEKAQLEELFTSFQRKHEPTPRKDCPLCNLDSGEEHIRYVGEGFIVVDTLRKKGHKERIMLLTKKHGVKHPKQLLEEAIEALIEVGMRVFEGDFCLLSDRFSSTRYHWHIVASDLDPDTEDYQQMMETPFVLVQRQVDLTAEAEGLSRPR